MSSLSEEILNQFWRLAETDSSVRIEAADTIVQFLANNEEHVPYAIKRLSRGLSSSRLAARQGFSIALTQVLKEIKNVDIQSFLDTLLGCTALSTANMKSNEQRDKMFGRLFGYMAFLRSRKWTLWEENDTMKSIIITVINDIVKMSKWKSWFRELCFESLLEWLRILPVEFYVSDIQETFLSEIYEIEETSSYKVDGTSVASWNADQLALALGIQHCYTSTAHVFGKFLRTKMISHLVEPMKASTSAFPRLHVVWKYIFAIALGNSSVDSPEVNPKINVKLVKSIWSILVEGILMNGTHERRASALKLLQFMSTKVNGEVFQHIFSVAFGACLFNNSFDKAYLHEASVVVMSSISTAQPESVFLQLQSWFLTPPKEEIGISTISETMNEEDVRDLQEDNERKVTKFRKWTIEAMVSVTGDEMVIQQVSKHLLYHGFYAPREEKTNSTIVPDVSARGIEHCQEKLFEWITNGIASFVTKNTTARKQNKKENMIPLTSLRCFSTCTTWMKMDGKGTILSKDAQECRTMILDFCTSCEKLNAKDYQSSKSVISESISVLLLLCGFYVMDETREEETIALVRDLCKGYKDFVSSKKEAAHEQSSVVLIDTMLSMLTQDCSVTRIAVKAAFRSICDSINCDAVLNLVHAAITPFAAEGHDEDDSDMSESDDDDAVEEEDEEEEEKTVLSTPSKSSRKGEGQTSNEEASDDDESSEEEEDEIVLSMDQVSEHLGEDAALANFIHLVKEKSERKNVSKKLRLQHRNFRSRVLDLLSVVPLVSSNKIMLFHVAIVPLLTFVKNAKNDDQERILTSKVQKLLQNKVSKSRGDLEGSSTSDDAERLHAIMEQVVDMMITKSSDKAFNVLSTNIVLHIVRLLFRSTLLLEDRLGVCIRKVSCGYFQTKHTSVNAVFFDQFMIRFPQLFWTCGVETLVSVVADNTASSSFASSECFRMLTCILKKHKEIVDQQKLLCVVAPRMERACVTALSNELLKPKRQKSVAQCALAYIKTCQTCSMSGENIFTDEFTKALQAKNGGNLKSTIDQSLKIMQEIAENK